MIAKCKSSDLEHPPEFWPYSPGIPDTHWVASAPTGTIRVKTEGRMGSFKMAFVVNSFKVVMDTNQT